MTFRVVRSPRAAAETLEIAAYLAEHSPPAAERFLLDLQRMQQLLSEYPNCGAPGALPGSRRLVVGDYIVSYRQRAGVIEIFGIRHGRRRDARF